MRSPFRKAPETASSPRIRALTGAPAKTGTQGKAPPPPAAGAVFREFVATLERLEKSRRRKKAPAAPTERS
ncbi:MULTISPECIES: hypothetical protein [Xanthobacter]|jgi:hypothetical protein|uniref:Uncharacterized protein n=1 Tax=Xanthobacter autotrophicus TaxID=280 RepID=A0A6C1KR83_XANAU|nr:hypothetical protein [Xanthobacter autotrophicus]TLX42456.1 hypothetical protein FBQ73_12455 [Xanthobacter autotrophicus]